MAHNMEIVDGVTSFARADVEALPWWANFDGLGEGQVFAKGTDWRQVADLANLNHEVTLHEMVTYSGPADEYLIDAEGSKLYRPVRNWKGERDGARTLLGQPFSERYGVVQVADMAAFALAICAIMPGAYIATAGAVRGGNRAFISVRLGEVNVEVNGFKDVTNLYLSILNSWDGSSPFAIANGSYRTVCDNTYRGNLAKVQADMKATKGNRRGDFISGGNVVLKHVGNMEAKLEVAKAAVAAEFGWATAYEDYATKLAQTSMTTQQFKKLIKAVIPEPKPVAGELARVTANNTNNYDRKMAVLMDEWKKESDDRGGRTAWAATNAFTALTSHYSIAKGTKLSAGTELESRTFGDTNIATQGARLMDQVQDYLKDFALAKV